MQNIRRLAVFKLRNIGDVLMITPFLRALRDTFPAARITAVVNSGTEAMLAHNPHVDEVLAYPRPDGTRGRLARLRDEIRFAAELRRRRFDLTIGLTDGQRTAWYSWLCAAPLRYGMVKRPEYRPRAYTHPMLFPGPGLHEADFAFDVLGRAGFKLRETGPRDLCLVVPEDLRAWARAEFAPWRPARIVHVHPVSRWLWKCWSPAAMAEVIDWLQTERHAHVVVTTGPAPRELEMAREIVRRCRTAPRFFPGDLSLSQIAALSAESDGYFGVDTAPMHMAAAVGVPVIALFGPTYPQTWGPRTPHATVLSKPCACNAAGSPQCDWNCTRACLAAISVAEAQAALDALLALPKIEPAPVA
ncbi:MAG: putative lipopolysaccharide heptosyltransferase III [Verrucomicrobiota bacterium]